MTQSDKNSLGKVGKVSLKPTDRLEELLKFMDDENLHELEVSDGAFEVKLVRQSLVPVSSRAFHAPGAGGASKSTEQKVVIPESGTPIKSPLAGIFYRSPSPQSDMYVKEGDVVTPEKTLCIIEAMKVLNEINAGVSGRIIKIMVENGKPVQSGQTLFVVEPT